MQYCTTQISLLLGVLPADCPQLSDRSGSCLWLKRVILLRVMPTPQGSPSSHPSLEQVYPRFRFPCWVGWELCWICTIAQLLPLLRPAPFPFLLHWRSQQHSLINLLPAHLHLTVCFIGSLTLNLCLWSFPITTECPVSSWCKSSFPIKCAFKIL